MPLVKLLGERLVSAGGKVIPTREALEGASAIGLYFSASWCPPCRAFTPVLVDSYKTALEKKGLRCVLVSWDKDEASFNGYFSQMPWLALPYSDREGMDWLGNRYSVQSIPTLALVDPDGRTITTDARNAVVRDGKGHNFPWRPPLVRDLAHGDPGRVNELPSVLCLCEAADPASRARVHEDLEAVAKAWRPARGEEYGYLLGSGGVLTERVRALCGLAGEGPRLVLLDIPDRGGFYLGPEGEAALEEGAARKLLADFEAGAL
eukprot:CAMPEP_0168429632 /NCGR_PEP_ID=MMETSP0228-20121227/37470_1 /TAXON_ID=133427 /ORGANISM="Protoceratium reticulatum, Strain CCCM 535 (=CCMP 1889)" /LENGTH=262 /DNA_ID=CAMNT_0008443723 /DNA_START=49 /DNA_END=834 /DNA_ORIENTATION=+